MQLPRLTPIAIAAAVSVVAHAQSLPSGLAIVAKLQGVTEIERHDTSGPQPLSVDSFIKAGDVVSTGAHSALLFVISNGARVLLGPNSRLRVVELLQETFPGTVQAHGIRLEPSRSVTRLMLMEGDIVGMVPALRADSKFSVSFADKINSLDATVFRVSAAATGKRAVVLSPRKFTEEDEDVFHVLARAN